MSMAHYMALFPVCRSVEDESAEYHFCESHQLNMSTLRMTSEAKVRVLKSYHACTFIPHFTFRKFL